MLSDTSYIVVNGLMSTFQRKFNHANPFSHSWNISQQSFYSYWWPDISVICCRSCISSIYAVSSHLGLPSATWFVKISPLVVEVQAEWSLWHQGHSISLYHQANPIDFHLLVWNTFDSMKDLVFKKKPVRKLVDWYIGPYIITILFYFFLDL